MQTRFPAPPRPDHPVGRQSAIQHRRPSRMLTVFGALSPWTAGYVLVIAAFAASALGSVLAKSALDLGATPVSFLFTRLVAAVAVLVVATGPALLRIPRRRRQQLAALGMLFGCQSLFYFSAVAISPVALVVVTVSSYPVVVLAMDAVVERRIPGPGRLIAMVGSLVGLWLAAGSPSARPDTGIVLALGSAVGYAVYLRVSAKVMLPARTGEVFGGVAVTVPVSPLVATAWVMIGALALVTVAFLATGQTLPRPTVIGMSVIHGIAATTLPLVAIYAALARIRASEIAVLGPLEPIIATGAAAATLGETLAFPQLLGIGIVIAAVATLSDLRPRIGLPRLPFVVPTTRRPAGVTRRVSVTSHAEVARLWAPNQS